MLSRTAGNLYWSARYLERAETMSRLLDMGYRMALIPGAREGYHNEWESILTVAGRYGFDERYDEVNSSNVLDFLFFDRSNSSSVVSCITAARENIRAQRTAVTAEVWDALNAGYQEIRGLEGQSRSADALPNSANGRGGLPTKRAARSRARCCMAMAMISTISGAIWSARARRPGSSM